MLITHTKGTFVRGHLTYGHMSGEGDVVQGQMFGRRMSVSHIQRDVVREICPRGTCHGRLSGGFCPEGDCPGGECP